MSGTLQSPRAEGRAFFSKTPESAFAPEDFGGDERLMIDEALRFSRQEVMPLQERLDAKEEGLMPGLIGKAGQLGFCGVDTSDQYGGLGMGKNVAARMLEMLSLNASFSVTYGVTSGIAQLGLSLFGTDEQKVKYLPKLTSGEWLGAYALSEPNSGSDALAMTCRAEETSTGYSLTGTKMWISNAMWAQSFLVLAKLDGEQVTAFLVERDFPGVSISAEEHKLGLHGSSTARLVLDNAQVPKENLLHLPGKGHQVAFNALNIGRFKLGAMSLGPARAAIYEAAGYAQDRKQFGQAISNFGLIQQKFADAAALYFAAEAMMARTGDGIDQAFAEYGGDVDGNRKAAEEFAIECSACKVFTTEAEAKIVDDMLQVYGGYGFSEEFPLARIYRDARVSRIYEGTNEINRVFLASRLRKFAEQGKASLDAAGDSFISELAGEAIQDASEDQTVTGAQSDLIILAYAEQSARLRKDKAGELGQMAYQRFVNMANVMAARAYQIAVGKSVTIPDPMGETTGALAESLYARRAPILG